MKCVWEELDNVNVLPTITVTPEITVFLNALNQQKEEQRLFQFLNGLDDHYGNLRTQLLLMVPLPSVENSCSMLQQEESQRMLFGSGSIESTALFSKGNVKDKCSICGFKWHPPERCWEKVGYPAWHPKAKMNGNKAGKQNGQIKNQAFNKTVAHVESGNISFTPQQFEQLLRSVQQMRLESDSEDGFGHQFAAGIACLNSQIDMLELLEGWIYDTGASDHMTPDNDQIHDPYMLKIKPQIKLPNGNTSVISHVGKVKLQNGLLLKDVLVVPSFKFSLLSVPKLTEDSQCVVSFYPKFCVVQDLATKKVKGLGKKKAGLYHLVNVPLEDVDSLFTSLVTSTLGKFAFSAVHSSVSVNKASYGLWHHRLGHVSDSKLKCMKDLPVSVMKTSVDNCLSCPMAKFSKLPYSLSQSHRSEVFELIHMDVWGPYRVPTDGKFRYFLTIVDDCSRVTWTYLLVNKSDSFVALKTFLSYVSTQFDKKVKVVRSDNAPEFVKG